MPDTRILIADDHELFRRGVASQIAQTPGYIVVAEAANGREAVEIATRERPDIIILDLTMPELNGLAAARSILGTNPGARVLILTAHESEQVVREVLDAGAQGYILKSDAARVLVSALQALRQGQPFFTSKIARMVIDGYLRKSAATGAEEALSTREREVVQLLAAGKSNKDVARTLGISVKTAETHRANLMRKIRCNSIADLVRYAVRNGLIEP